MTEPTEVKVWPEVLASEPESEAEHAPTSTAGDGAYEDSWYRVLKRLSGDEKNADTAEV